MLLDKYPSDETQQCHAVGHKTTREHHLLYLQVHSGLVLLMTSVRDQMRKLLKVVALAALVLGSFGAGVITTAIFHFGSPIVTVQLQNASAQKIASVHLEHEHGSLSVTNIDPGDSRKVCFYSPGESSYKIQVAFADGHTISGGAGYVEAGYGITEVISDVTIKSDFQRFTYAP